MFLIEKAIDEMTDLEADFLMPFDVSLLEQYYFAMDKVSDNGNWSGYIVTPDDSEVMMVYNASKGTTKYRKDDAYYTFIDDAKKVFPLDSCAIDTMSALLVLSEAHGWDVIDD